MPLLKSHLSSFNLIYQVQSLLMFYNYIYCPSRPIVITFICRVWEHLGKLAKQLPIQLLWNCSIRGSKSWPELGADCDKARKNNNTVGQANSVIDGTYSQVAQRAGREQGLKRKLRLWSETKEEELKQAGKAAGLQIACGLVKWRRSRNRGCPRRGKLLKWLCSWLTEIH